MRVGQPRGDSSTADKARVYLDTYRVLRPEVEKLMTLMQFCEGLVEAVPDALAYLLRKSKAAAPVPRQVCSFVVDGIHACAER